MPKEFTTDPNPSPTNAEAKAIGEVAQAISKLTAELEVLRYVVERGSEELVHLNAAVCGQQEAILGVASALLIDPKMGISASALRYRREMVCEGLDM